MRRLQRFPTGSTGVEGEKIIGDSKWQAAAALLLVLEVGPGERPRGRANNYISILDYQ